MLTRLMVRGLNQRAELLEFTPSDMVEWFGVSPSTAREWLEKWQDDGFIAPAKPGAQRVRSYLLAEPWARMLKDAVFSATVKQG